ncbi:hypothetical protein [Salimicrobium halophilum]|uniref:Uncharacterized protein n=1 Tax=Salimicrobium halophilum TaxID=86666 RepID=A0A1G8R3E6_9BACI|nr:hypothetical protein [Salimicrobium halophilum]SDJ11085.1 hypothetical protein SAMN04490247_0776 [Salimicrobium halophilum]
MTWYPEERQGNWEQCRQRCFELGYRPGTVAWQQCVHGCLGMSAPAQQYSIPDQWVQYMRPLTDHALERSTEETSHRQLLEESILSGILIGQGYTPEEAMRAAKKEDKK